MPAAATRWVTCKLLMKRSSRDCHAMHCVFTDRQGWSANVLDNWLPELAHAVVDLLHLCHQHLG